MILSAKRFIAIAFTLLGSGLYFRGDRINVAVPVDVTPLLPSINRLQQYLRIRTDHPQPSYDIAVSFLNTTITNLIPDARVSIHSLVHGKPLLLATIPGSNPALPSILLNSHTDVVPAEPTRWSHPPFAANIVIAGGQLRLYARGAQDMKSVGLQYVEALAEMLATSWRPLRTIHLLYVPDEEVGGIDGMGRFVKTNLFKSLNIGAALDEGLPHPDPKLNVYYGERQTWWLRILSSGEPGHGATLPESTAGMRLTKIVENVMKYRQKQLEKLNQGADLGEIVNVNLVYLKAGQPDENISSGFAMNMIPTHAEAGFDIRVPPTIPKHLVEQEMKKWLICENEQPCEGISLKWVIKVDIPTITSRDAKVNPFIEPFNRALDSAGVASKVKHGIFPAATDGRYLREAGIPCFGFSPITETPNLLHKHDEFITVNGYINGYRIYKNIIRELADFSMSKETEEKTDQITDVDKDVQEIMEAEEIRLDIDEPEEQVLDEPAQQEEVQNQQQPVVQKVTLDSVSDKTEL